MRQLIAIIALVALTLPASASEGEPQVLDLEIEGGDRLVVADWSHGENHVVHWGIVGHYLWLEWGDENRDPDSNSGNHVSIDLSDLTIRQVVAYPDGTVDIIREIPESEETSAPPNDPIDVMEEFPSIDWPRLIPAGVRPL